MRTFIFLPPVHKPVGGVAVLFQIAAHLRQAGQAAFLVPREKGGWAPQAYAGMIPEIPWAELNLTPEDIWLVPEGWVNALAPGLAAKSRCLLYCQNWAYLFSSLPPDLNLASLPLRFLAVSQPVAWFIEQTVPGMQGQTPDIPRPDILRPGIDLATFCAPAEKPSDRLRVAYMPRKNKALVQQVRAIFQSRNRTLTREVEFAEISGLDAPGVARVLQDSHVFLASGFPEGCPLPPLEALACGCLPVGFSGFGGWDYMRQAREHEARFRPWWPLRPVHWAGNGLWSADADVLDAALNLETALEWWKTRPEELARTLAAGQQTAAAYGLDQQRAQILALWKRLTP